MVSDGWCAEAEREQGQAHQADVKEKLKSAQVSLAAKQKESKLLDQSRRQAGCACCFGLPTGWHMCSHLQWFFSVCFESCNASSALFMQLLGSLQAARRCCSD